MNDILKSVSTSKQGPGEQLKYIVVVQEWPRTGWRAERSESGKVAKCMKAGKRESGKAGKRESAGTGTGIYAELCRTMQLSIMCTHSVNSVNSVISVFVSNPWYDGAAELTYATSGKMPADMGQVFRNADPMHMV